MAKRQHRSLVVVEDLDVQLKTILDGYSAQVTVAVDMCAEEAVKQMEAETKKTAPVGVRKSYRRHITSGVVRNTRYTRAWAWYVKPPDHRLTHLLVKGHATKDGERTDADPFLKNAVDNAVAQLEERLARILKNGGPK